MDYPLPRMDDILENLGKCAYFTTLDLTQGFHQIPMDKNSIKKTAITVENGHYEYRRTPFRLKNAPAIFQRMMDKFLMRYLHRFCFVYMDDVVIFSKSLQEHLQHLKLLFDEFRKYNLKIQLDKSEFLRKEVPFLRHIIIPNGSRGVSGINWILQEIHKRFMTDLPKRPGQRGASADSTQARENT